jgi:hypothetical protein
MKAQRASNPLSKLTQELARFATAVSRLELRLAGSLDPAAGALLERLCGASRHLLAAQNALAGVGTRAERSEAEPLQGTSRSVPIQDLLCFLATGKKSGVLRVHAGEELFLLQLDQGAVVYAAGDRPPAGESLGELLAAQGVDSTEILGNLPGSTGGAWVDKNLVGTSWISREPLVGAIQQQTRLSVFRLCAARESSFRFYEGAEIENVVPVRQNAMELLLEYSRALDEGSGPGVAPFVSPESQPVLQARAEAREPRPH